MSSVVRRLLVVFVTSGEFGVVYKGHLVKHHGQVVTETVAVKTLKGNCMD